MKKLNEFNKERINRELNSNEPVLNGIECPECSSELYDSSPMVTLSSYPAKKSIHCQRCSYRGYRLV